MSANRKTAFARLAYAGAAIIVLAVLGPARAQVPAGTRAATPAAIPAAMPAVNAPTVRPAPAQPVKPAALPPVACSAPAEFARLDHPLRRTAQRLAGGEPLTIVAIGSSSTAGAGASSPAASYPSRLAVELRQRFPGQDITVLNRGVNGEETHDMIARFDDQRHRRTPATRALAARHQFRAARSPAQAAFRAAARRHRGTQGGRRRRGADRSAILAESSRQAGDAGHGRSDCARPPRRRTSICSAASRSCATGTRTSTCLSRSSCRRTSCT